MENIEKEVLEELEAKAIEREVPTIEKQVEELVELQEEIKATAPEP